MNRSLAFICALLLASLTISSACFAGPIDDGSTLVRYGDLDLATPAGVKVLQHRIEVALDQVCLDPNGPGPVGTVDTGCKPDGRRAAQAQMTVAIAQQQERRSATGTEVSIQFAKPQPSAATDH